jgi:hypothetical protein
MLAVPGSTLQDDLDTIKFSRKARVTCPGYSTTVPMKNTELYNYSIQQGLIDDPATHESDMTGLVERSKLPCFTEREKNIRYNVFLMGALIAKLPFPLDRAAIALIKVIPPNVLFRKINDYVVDYHYKHKIYRLSEDNLRAPRMLKQSGAK